MPPQAAYDIDSPNGSSRLPQGERVIAVFRLYRRPGPTLPTAPESDGLLGSIRDGLRTARTYLQAANQFLQAGRVLEREYQFVLFLDALSETPEVRSRFSYTRDGYFIDVPAQNAKGVTRFRLQGRTHWTPVLVNGVQVDGDAALKDFKELIDDRFFPANGAPPGEYELVWFNYLAAISAEDPFGEFEWLIHPVRNGVQVNQIAQRPFLRSFTFEFLGLQSNRDKAKAEDGFLAGLLSRDFLRSLLESVHLGAVADGLDAVFGIVDEFQGLLTDAANVVTAVTDYVVATRQAITVSIAKVRGLFTAVQTIIGRIEDGIDLARDIPNLTSQQLALLRQNTPGLMGSAEPGYIATGELRTLRTFLAGVIVQADATAAPLGGRQQTVAIDVAAGVTIERLARDASVSPELLIQANDLRYPFIDARARSESIATAAAEAVSGAASLGDDAVAASALVLANADRALARLRTHSGAPDDTVTLLRTGAGAAKMGADRIRAAGAGTFTPAELSAISAASVAAASFALTRPSLPKVLYAGDRLRVPQPSPGVVPSVVGRSGNQILTTGGTGTEEERLFGVDLRLDDAGDLGWDETTLDFALARGLDNMARTQDRYVKLPLGALRFAPSIGNFAFEDIAKWQGPGTNRLLAYALFRTLSQDPRVKRVRRMRAETRGGKAWLTYDAQLINGQDVPELRAPLG